MGDSVFCQVADGLRKFGPCLRVATLSSAGKTPALSGQRFDEDLRASLVVVE